MDALGINIINIVISTSLFIALFLVLNKFLFKPLGKAIKERKKKIDDSLKKAEEIEQKLNQANIEYNKKLEEAGKMANKLIEEARQQAEEEYKKIVTRAQEEARQFISNAKKKIEKDRERLEAAFDNKLRNKVKEEIIKLWKEKGSTLDNKFIDNILSE